MSNLIDHNFKRYRRAMTLVELLMALSIMGVVSTAVFSMIHAAGNVSSVVTTSIGNDTELQTAIERMVQEGRTCVTLTAPTSTTAGTTLSFVSQPDATNGNQSYDISYTLSGTNLQETQYLHNTTTARFAVATTTIIHNVQSFSVALKSAGTPQVAVVTLTVGTQPPATRTFRITPRNQ